MSVVAPLVWTPRRVISLAAEAFDVTERELVGTRRFHPLVQYRQVVYAALKAFCGLSYVQTAKVMGRDHSSVQYGIKRVASDPELQKLYAALVERLTEAGVG